MCLFLLEIMYTMNKVTCQTTKTCSKVLFMICTLMSCSDDEASLTESFFKIYDDSDFDLAYDPIDVVETADGYIILTGTEISSSDFDGIQVLKIDREGNFVQEREIADYVAPAGDIYLNPSDSNVYFFALEPVTPEAVLLSIDTDLNLVQTSVLSGLKLSPIRLTVVRRYVYCYSHMITLRLRLNCQTLGLTGPF